MSYLLDTCVVSELSRPRPQTSVGRFLERLPGAVHGIAHQPLHVPVQYDCGSHLCIVLPRQRAVKMLAGQMLAGH